MSLVYADEIKAEMLTDFGSQLEPPVSRKEMTEVFEKFGGVDRVEEILHKFGHSTLSYLHIIAKNHELVPVTFPDHVTLADGKSYFLLLF